MPGFECWVPLLTLMDADYRPLPELIAAHLAWLKAQGAYGILVLGTTGEFASLSVVQRQRYLETVLNVNPGLAVMVNIGAAALSDILALQAHAVAQPSVDSILMMPPFYFPGDLINGLDALIGRVLAHQPEALPFYLYHYPKLSQVSISAELMDQFPRIAGIKDTSGDFDRIAQWTARFPDRKLYAGTDVEIARSIAAGCAGVIAGLGNVFSQLISAAIMEDEKAHAQLRALRSLFDPLPKLPAMKAYLNHLALAPAETAVFPPFKHLSPEQFAPLLAAITEVLT